MEKSYKFRIYPNKQQKQLLAKTFGCARYVYNYYLDKKIKLYRESQESLSYNNCSADLTKLKQEKIWLKEVDKCALQNALKNLDCAYQNFFKLHNGFPKFKSRRDNHKSYRTNSNIKYYEKYTNEGCLTPERNAVKRLCMAFDIYYKEDVFNSSMKKIKESNMNISPMGQYMKTIQLSI